MNVVFDNQAHDCVAPFIAESLRKAIKDREEMRGEHTLIFTTRTVEPESPIGDTPAQCFADFTVISDESAYHFPFPSPKADTCNGMLYYSLIDGRYAYPALRIQVDGLATFCDLITERLIEAFTDD